MESVMKKMMVLLLVGFVHFTLIAGDTVSGKVISVIDGNTLEVEGDDNEVHKVQLAGIDCPELEQEFGDRAKSHLQSRILNKKVIVTFVGKDRLGNYLATVMINGTIDIRLELLEEGLAWTAERNPLPELETIKEQAREKEKGLWKLDNPTPPWVYRRQQTMMQVKGS
jgi:endonuclease YncB( thermonuclease family)